jgi:hypothetical protein
MMQIKLGIVVPTLLVFILLCGAAALVFFPLMSEQGVLAEDALRVAAMALVLCIALGSYLVWYCTRYFFRPLRRFT